MALSLSVTSHSLLEFTPLNQHTFRRLRFYSSSKIRTSLNPKPLRFRQIRAVRENTIPPKEEREVPVINGVDSLKLNGNGSVGSYLNGNGGVKGSGNGRLVKFVDGDSVVATNGVAGGVSDAKVAAIVAEQTKAVKKKSVEDIGQEDAWFKQGGRDQLEVVHLCSTF